MNSVRFWPRGRFPPGCPYSWVQFFQCALWWLMPWHCSALCWYYVTLVACPILAVLGARIKRAWNNNRLYYIIILLTLCSVYAGLCASLCARLYAVLLLFDYAKSCKNNQKLNTFAYASFMRFIPMRRMFQVLLYAGFMQHFFWNIFLI